MSINYVALLLCQKLRHKFTECRSNKFQKGSGVAYAAFTRAGLTTKYRTKGLYKSILRCQSHAIVYEEVINPA